MYLNSLEFVQSTLAQSLLITCVRNSIVSSKNWRLFVELHFSERQFIPIISRQNTLKFPWTRCPFVWSTRISKIKMSETHTHLRDCSAYDILFGIHTCLNCCISDFFHAKNLFPNSFDDYRVTIGVEWPIV